MQGFKIYDLGLRNKRNWVLLIILTTYFLNPASIHATNATELEQKIDQVRQDRETLIAEQKRLQAELEAVNREAQTIGTAVKSLDTAKKKLTADINVTRSKINSSTLTIQSLEKTMNTKEQQIVAHRKAIASTLAVLSEYDSRPLVLNLLASASLSDLWRDRSKLDELNIHLQEEIDALRETRQALNKEKEEKEIVKKEQVSLQGQLSSQKLVVEENQKAKEILLAETKSKEATYQKMLADNIARQKQSEADLFRLESELQIILDPSLIPSAKHGILSWPLDKVFVTQQFGHTEGGKRLYASGFHNGVDFRASVGTPVKAMLSGVVEGVGNTDEQNGCYSYGRWILIKHPNGITSIYSHLSASMVSKGQEVKTGEVIGLSGGQPRVFGSGYSTGPHLHVGLFASQGVEIRQFVTSKGCKQVFVPIALGVNSYLDPLAYLMPI